MKSFAFFFHYNKPKSMQVGRPQISLHYKGTCHIVDNVYVYVSTHGRLRNSAPKFVMAGQAHEITIKNNLALIV